MNLIFFAVFASVAVQILQNRSIYLRESSTKKGLRKSRKPSSLLTKSTLYPFGSAFVVRLIGIEPTTTRRRRPVLYPLSYKRMCLGRVFGRPLYLILFNALFKYIEYFLRNIIYSSNGAVFNAGHPVPAVFLSYGHCVIV